ncbi:DUF4041 domain-containing protein [Streptococcus hyovaginalis]|uniref:DUF4041 domain-containing protein n=1 Tax=Streptococcus hyovaginalis TaxID=149015 RepID=UPI002A841442|nr:DUF4041 domain-containing protein [Streptococcus hyovaginalis]MDY4510767.1 DUF4041 domain-containing protein [Streptococcus hyovaginalis]
MKNNLPFYYRGWFFAMLILISPLTIFLSLIVLVSLFSQRNEKFPNLTVEEKKRLDEIKEANINAETILKEANEKSEKIISEARVKVDEIRVNSKSELSKIEQDLEEAKQELSELETTINQEADQALFVETTVDFTDNITSNEIKNELSIIQLNEKEIIKNNKAVSITSSEKKTIANKQAKQLLRAFNAEADYYTSNVTMKNVDTFRNKLAKSFENLNKLFEIDGVELTQDYLKSKLKQLDIIFKYQKQIEIEKELLKAQKEEIREQQKAEKEIQDAKRKIEKEEQQFNNEMSKLLKYLNGANNDVEQRIYADKIKELEEKIKLLEKDKEDVLHRESNTRAGYVYIISNIGSFGENIYKIGMTRRLEPMDRIAELSSASVPFPFDVHALIFSEDAPSLENTLHNYFRKKEVNKVNNRKEFFKVNLDEIKEVVHKEHNNTVHFTDLAVAEQYYESLKLENQNIG